MPNHQSELRLAHNRVIQESRLALLRESADTFSHYLNSGADAAKRSEMIMSSVLGAITSYREQLFEQALRLSTQENKAALLALVGGDSQQFNNINNDVIQGLRKDKTITNTQSLFLHQLATLNDMLSEVDGIQKNGIGNQTNLFKLLELLNNLDNSVKFVVEVGIKDPDSYRVFQLLNHFAYASFTSVLWEKLVVAHDLDASLESVIEKFLAEAIKTNENGDAHSEQLTYDSFSQLKDSFRRNAADWFRSNRGQIRTGAKELSEHLIPVFLGIGADKAELCKLNVIICELLDKEQEQDCESLDKKQKQKQEQNFVLTVEFFDSYLGVCFNKPEQREEKHRLRARISTYIDYARSVRDARKVRTEIAPIDPVAQEKAERIRLLKVIKKTKELRSAEQDNLQLLNEAEQKAYSNFLKAASPEGRREVMAKLEAASSVTPEVLSLIGTIVSEDKVKDLIGAFSRIMLRKASLVDNQRINFYDNLILLARKQLVEIDTGILKYIDTVNDRAQSLLLVAHTDDYIFRDDDHYPMFITKSLNPSEYALTKYMPSGIVYRLRVINDIESAILELTKLHAKCVAELSLEGKENEDNKDNKRVKQAVGRIKDTLEKLTAKRAAFEPASLVFTLKTLESIIEQQIEDHKTKNHELHAANKITDIQRKERKAADKARVAGLRATITDLKTLLKGSDFSTLTAEQKQAEITDLMTKIKAVEERSIVGNADFDLSVVSEELTRTANYYSADNLIKQAVFKHAQKPEMEYQENKGWMPWFIEKVRSFVNIYNILQTIINVVVSIFKFIINMILFPFAETFKFFSRIRAQNKELVGQIKALSESIDDILQNGVQWPEKCTEEALELTAKEKEELVVLKTKLKELDDKVGRFSHSFTEVRGIDGYSGLKKEFKQLKESKQARYFSGLADAVNDVLKQGLKLPENEDVLIISAEEKTQLAELKIKLQEFAGTTERFSHCTTTGLRLESYKVLNTEFDTLKQTIGARHLAAAQIAAPQDGVATGVHTVAVRAEASGTDSDNEEHLEATGSPTLSSRLPRTFSASSLTSEEDRTFSGLVNVAKAIDTDEGITQYIKNAAHADFLLHLPVIIEKKKQEVLAKIPADLATAAILTTNATAACDAISAEIAVVVEAFAERTFLTVPELDNLDKLISKFDTLAIRVARQVSPPTRAEAVLIISKKLIEIVHGDPVIRKAVSEAVEAAVEAGGANLVLGSDIMTASSNIFSQVVNTVLKAPTAAGQAALTDLQIAAMTSNQKFIIIARRVVNDIYADPEVREALEIATGSGLAALSSNRSMQQALAEAFISGIKQLVEGASLVSMPVDGAVPAQASGRMISRVLDLLDSYSGAIGEAIERGLTAVANGHDHPQAVVGEVLLGHVQRHGQQATNSVPEAVIHAFGTAYATVAQTQGAPTDMVRGFVAAAGDLGKHRLDVAMIGSAGLVVAGVVGGSTALLQRARDVASCAMSGATSRAAAAYDATAGALRTGGVRRLVTRMMPAVTTAALPAITAPTTPVVEPVETASRGN